MTPILIRVAVILTCHDRRQKSTRSVGTVLSSVPPGWSLRVFAVDDGSTDGTAEALARLGDRVEVIAGSGDLYWSGGMRLASRHAERWAPDFVMWLNDDVDLAPDFLTRAAEFVESRPSATAEVMVGRIVSPDTGTTVYGVHRRSPRSPIAFELRRGPHEPADSFNGNVVLFGMDAYKRLGGFPANYRHGYADFVMGVRAGRAHVPIIELPFPAGFDRMNDKTGRMFDPSVRFTERVRFALSPFGIPPRDQLRFCREVVGGTRAWVYFLRSYVRVLVPRRAAV